MSFRYAICNETYQDWPHERVCEAVAATGYIGLELAPFTFAPRITDVTPKQRSEIRKQTGSRGLTIVGLHWLLAKTEGFMLTSPDAEVRKRTGQYLAELARCCRDVGGEILVLGSPMQRRIPPGTSRALAEDYAIDSIGHALPELERQKVDLCLEPLAPTETDFLQTAAEGKAMMDRLAHPRVKLHLDVKAMSSEAKPVPDVIREFAPWMKHFHANDANRRGPGFGKTDFVPIFKALKDVKYAGWVSVEVFDYTPDPETIARESLRHMRECEAKA
ncbi:MAG TPA: sugar phosphate isomerase/epimerase family protein [Gemmataceae bacterium]|nr:sugar phosphate isomerase/epimerase family protein [Gemmataceae bacterium]